MTTLFRLADHILNRPLLLTPDKAQVIFSVLSDRIGMPQANRFEGEPIKWDEYGQIAGAPYQVAATGVAVISIIGSLVNRGAWLDAQSGLVSYEGLTRQIKTALNDNKIHSVIFDLNSPGGEAVGCFELADQIRTLSAKKKTVALVNGMACSAAYAIASAANEIVTTTTGVSGSIGVVFLHADFSRQLDSQGVTPTFIHAGAHKVDGNPFEPLSDVVKADIQNEIDAFYNAFLTTVAKGRGKRLSVAAAKKTEARTFIGQAAVDAGLADRIGTFETVLHELTRAAGRSNVQKRSKPMDDHNEAAAQTVENVPQLEHEKAVSAARQEGERIGAQAACDRFKAIAGSDDIKAHPSRLMAALDLAIKSPTMTADDVVAFVSANIQGEKPFSNASLASRINAPADDPLLNTNEQKAVKAAGPLTALAQQQNGGINGRF